MRTLLSWLKDYVEIKLPILELAARLTMAGLEVEEIELVGLPVQAGEGGDHQGFKVSGLAWAPDKIVVAEVREVMPHPNADRLVLCRLFDGVAEHVVLTGAPNLFPYRGTDALAQPLKVAYAREGAQIYDGHQPGRVLTTLKRAKIRGVDSYSMICSEKELGISDDHEGVILLDADAPTGAPLAEYMGDVVFEIKILPNVARNTSMLGIAREVAALTGQSLRKPKQEMLAEGPSVAGKVALEIRNPQLNPRFTAGLVENVTIGPSPYWVQRRLKLAGMRPINNIVDATNYVMWDVGEPLHAFDYDVLLKRAGGKPPRIITRQATDGESLTTLDGMERKLDTFNVLVCDTAGALSLAGVMGGQETEVNDRTRNVLLEGASWNFINIRRTIAAQKFTSEAAFRFSRGVHPALAPLGVTLGLERMRQWAGGRICQGLVDEYPAPVEDPTAEVRVEDIRRVLGIELTARQAAELLSRLDFTCQVVGDTVKAQTPPHRLDIGEGAVGRADLLEEIARMYGYENIPETHLQDVLPRQSRDLSLEGEDRVRDLLVVMGLQEAINHRLTEPASERRIYPPAMEVQEPVYVRLSNPISSDRVVMRTNLLASLLGTLEHNARLRERLAFFEIGPVFLVRDGQELPDEPRRLAIAMTGLRLQPAWDTASEARLDFYDLKGIIEGLLDGLHIQGAEYRAGEHPSFHPGKRAELYVGERRLGALGELHPLVKANFDFGDAPVVAAELDLDALLDCQPKRYTIQTAPAFPPVLEDLAIVVDEGLEAARVEAIIQQAGGKLLAGLRLFDTFRGEQIGQGKKSLAYRLTYQAPDRTLSTADAGQVRQKIIRRLEQELGAKLRS